MQLGELQGQLERFKKRGAKVVALSVDSLKESRSLIKRMKLSFNIVSDENQNVMQSFRVQNPDTEELALHAVYIVDRNRQIFYRKVAGRRPRSQELLDALDYYAGRYPLKDDVLTTSDYEVAYPENIFQAIIELSSARDLPKGMSPELFGTAIEWFKAGENDETVIALRQVYMTLNHSFPRSDLLTSAAWITNNAFSIEDEVLKTGGELNASLAQIRSLRSQREEDNVAIQKEMQHLDALRSKIRENASAWNLGYVKSMLREFRELAIAATQE